MKKQAKRWINQLADNWNRFWFEANGQTQIRYFRIGFGWMLFAFYIVRSLDLDLFYGENGISTLASLSDIVPQHYRFSVFSVFTSRAALWIGNGVFLASLLSFALGVLPRLSAIIALILHVSFVHRNPAVAYGADTISCFLLFFMCLADHRDDRKYRAGDWQAVLGSVAYRLCQIQVCVIYGYSGLKKLKGLTWWSGEAVWSTLADPQLARMDFTWISHFPLTLLAASFVTLAWEIYFPALIWIRGIRVPFLILGVLLHLGIAIGINLPFFGTLMIMTYLFFLEPAQIRAIFSAASSIFLKVRRTAAD